MARIRTNLTLEPLTLGILRYLIEVGDVDSLYEIIDILVETYAENYAEVNGVDFNELKHEAMELFTKSRRPQSTKSKEEQMKDARKSLEKMKIKRRTNDSLGGKIIDTTQLGDDF